MSTRNINARYVGATFTCTCNTANLLTQKIYLKYVVTVLWALNEAHAYAYSHTFACMCVCIVWHKICLHLLVNFRVSLACVAWHAQLICANSLYGTQMSTRSNNNNKSKRALTLRVRLMSSQKDCYSCRGIAGGATPSIF